ncbi:MAG: cellobiose phosphorylase [Candidatus Omnitrophota bacterium]
MTKNFKNKKPKYYLNDKDEFIIENYNYAKPFASFFPGIAGEYGIPMWLFYVNRGQAIISFGVKNRDHAILEFLPANKAWESVSLLGFRTFVKILSSKDNIFYEPFHNGFTNIDFDLNTRMSITSHDLNIQEENTTLGLKTEVEYFNIPQDSYAGLVRIVTIKNTGKKTRKIQLLDGVPKIVPYGIYNLFLKKLSRTVEAWMKVENLENHVPFFKVDVDPIDRPQVIHIKEGNFFLGFHFDKNNHSKIIKPVVDPQCIFGPVSDFSCPYHFLGNKIFRYPKNQITQNKTPCAFLDLDFELPPNSQKTYYSIIGNMRNLKILNSSLSRITKAGYLDLKKKQNKETIENLQNDISTRSSSREFDLYAKQTYLDNIMRGGYPVSFKSKLHKTIFYLYSRKHGDLERDYNKYELDPTYFSQGNGNYRDINQNRRCDNWFNPEVTDENITMFLNLIQLDGFNPLVVKGALFRLTNPEQFFLVLETLIQGKITPETAEFFSKSFTPGEVIIFFEEKIIKLKVKPDEFINILLSHCQKSQEASFHEGFWTDHWAYNLDLIENYLAIYPEKLKELAFEKKDFTFYDYFTFIKPRCQKYLLLNGLPKQLHSVGFDDSKKVMLENRVSSPRLARTDHGQGEVYKTTCAGKLICILANKLASLDPSGIGIEMEADKPNWFDSLNGLPALFGSSSCETFELKRLAIFLKESLKKNSIENVFLAEEIYNLLFGLGALIREYFTTDTNDKDFIFWDKTHTLKEEYRQKTNFGVSGKEKQVNRDELITILEDTLKKLDSGLNKAWDNKENIYYSYFINVVEEFVSLEPPFIKPTKFEQKKVPFFLEGPFHALRLMDKAQAQNMYKAILKSQLYDKKLKMYKVTSSLASMPEEIGRCRVFTPGWLENESIWLHMEYKYLLELLKCGLYEEFFQDFKNCLIPFQKPEVYGRSILENSSFLVSSVFPDKKLHGNGFVARLSGSTAEFLNIWLVMNIGKQPFVLNNKNELNLKFCPILPRWLFSKDRTYTFNFLSKITVIYHNPERKNTFGKAAALIKKIILSDQAGNTKEITSEIIPSPYAEQIRNRQIKKIDIYLE